MTLLWLGAALPLFTAALLASVGVLVATRPARAESRLARGMFVTWWFSASAVILLTGVRTLAYLAGVRAAFVYEAITYALAVPLAAGLCGVLFYLLFIYTGRRGLLWPLAALYAGFFAFELFYFGSFGPRHLEETSWSVRFVSADPPGASLRLAFGVLVAAPVLAAIVAYASLLLRVREREQRFRIALVSCALALWFGPLFAAYLAGADDSTWFPLVYQVPGLVASALIVLAFRPPRWARAPPPAERTPWGTGP